jgi:hypothetical protein
MRRDATLKKKPYASREGELEAIRWYLAGRLDVHTKLNSQLGAAVNAYEHLRHSIEFASYQQSFRVQLKLVGISIQLWVDPVTGRLLSAPEFPELPFTKLSPGSRVAVLRNFEPKLLLFYPTAIWELDYWGILKKLSELAKDSNNAEGTATGEVKVFSQLSVIPFTADFGAGITGAQRSFLRWPARTLPLPLILLLLSW